MYGKDWKKIQESVKTRTYLQVKKRGQNILRKIPSSPKVIVIDEDDVMPIKRQKSE